MTQDINYICDINKWNREHENQKDEIYLNEWNRFTERLSNVIKYQRMKRRNTMLSFNVLVRNGSRFL